MRMTDAEAKRRAQKLLRATCLLGDAVKILQEEGVSVALSQGRRSLASVQAAMARDAVRRRAPAAKPLELVVRAMPQSLSELVRNDGTLRFVSYMKASGRRPAVVAVSFRMTGAPNLTTTFSLDGRDFGPVYEAAVRALAGHIGVSDNPKIMSSMLATGQSFSTRYGI